MKIKATIPLKNRTSSSDGGYCYNRNKCHPQRPKILSLKALIQSISDSCKIF